MANKVNRILILGKGRIGKAVQHYLRKYSPKFRVSFFNKKTNPKNYSLFISALPGDVGRLGLRLALRFKKDLIDLSDVEHKFYLKAKKEIKKRKILVAPLCGFSPGLTNFICGREAKENKVARIEILAGTLSPKEHSFPFLWCFKDLIEGHTSKAVLIKSGRKIKAPPFSDLRKEKTLRQGLRVSLSRTPQEKIRKIEAESYLADGLTSLPHTLEVKNMSYRILRPAGFYIFFEYLKSHGFFKKENIAQTKKILEAKKENNLTAGIIRVKTSKKEIVWQLKSFSKSDEKLNSMQKITAILPAALAQIVLKGDFSQKGLFFPEQLGADKTLFKKIINKTNRVGGIRIMKKRKQSQAKQTKEKKLP